MFIQRLQITAVILISIMFLIVCALLLESTMVADECPNCSSIFHNFSTNCTLGLANTIAQSEEIQAVIATTDIDIIDSDLQNNTILTQTKSQIGDDYLNKITFIGDSRFVVLNKYGIDQSNIYAKSGLNHKQALTWDFIETSDGENITLIEALEDIQTDIILMNFGVNGAGWFTDDEFISTYHELLDLIQDNVDDDIIIIMQSILPIAKSYESKENGFPNARIDDLNQYLIEIADERGLYYLDSSDVLKDEDNFLDTKFTGDGLHFNDEAYDLLLENIKDYSIYK